MITRPILFSSATLFLGGSILVFILEKKNLKKAGQINKYDITKASRLVQVFV